MWLYCSLNYGELPNQQVDRVILSDEAMVFETFWGFFSMKSVVYQRANAIAQAANIIQR